MVDKSEIDFRNLSAALFRERNILQKLQKCQFVTDLHTSFLEHQEASFLLEFCSGGDLFERLLLEGPFDEATARFYVAQMARALDQEHSREVVSGDLKPEDFLFDRKWYLKLTDFGCRMDQSEGVSGKVGTPEYMAPRWCPTTRRNTPPTFEWTAGHWAVSCSSCCPK